MEKKTTTTTNKHFFKIGMKRGGCKEYVKKYSD